MKMTKTLETIPEGMRILVRPADATNVDKVRAMVTKHVVEKKAKLDAAKTSETPKAADDAPKPPAVAK